MKKYFLFLFKNVCRNEKKVFPLSQQTETKKDMATSNFKFVSIPASSKIVQESEKAVKIAVIADSFGGRTASEKEFWFPKSVVQIGGERILVANWFAMKCFQENKGIRFDYTNNHGFNA